MGWTFRTPFAGTSRIRFSGCVLSLDDEAPRYPKATIGLMTDAPRYDGHAEYYEDFRGELGDDELEALDRLLGPGSGRCLDISCGTGVPTAAVARLGWSVVGAKHLPLHDLFGAFTSAGLRIERFEELGDRDYPPLVGLRAHS